MGRFAILCPMSWQQIWDRLASTEWVADTGVPLVLQLLAILVAWIFLRKQLKSDRELLEASWKKDRELLEESSAKSLDLQKAAARAAGAHRLAFSIVYLANYIHSAFRNPDFSSVEVKRLHSEIRAEGHSLLTLAQAGELWSLFEDLAMIVHIGNSFRDEVPDDDERRRVTSLLSSRSYIHIVGFASSLRAWDGVGEVPKLHISEERQHSDHPQWEEDRRTEFRDTLRKMRSAGE